VLIGGEGRWDALRACSVVLTRYGIGGEGRWDALRACSVVLTRYGIANYATGALGVLGPMRMAYGHTISALRFVADVLSDMVYEMYQPGLEEVTK